jgi:hypothetical protein
MQVAASRPVAFSPRLPIGILLLAALVAPALAQVTPPAQDVSPILDDDPVLGEFLRSIQLEDPSLAAELRAHPRAARACMATFVHGITPELTQAEIGADAVPLLHRLLVAPSFPRRDNVVAFLGFSGGDAEALAIAGYLAQSPARTWTFEEDRAFLNAPRALAYLAHAGSPVALEVLLDLTDESKAASRVGALPAGAPSLQNAVADAIESATWGLALAADSVADGRLAELASGAAGPNRARVAVQAQALALEVRGLVAPAPMLALDNDPAPNATPLSSGAAPASQGEGRVTPGAMDRQEAPPEPDIADTAVIWHETPLDYANHRELTAAQRMNDARLDDVMAESGLLVGSVDFVGDISCCNTFRRTGTGGSWGSVGDGLVEIDDGTELGTALAIPGSRVKIVRAINWCGAPSVNTLGCANSGGGAGGYGIVIVRHSDVRIEGALWAHEYGHNTGQRHNPDNRYIMFATLSVTTNGVDAGGCSRYHAPPGPTQMVPDVMGPCADSDGDQIHDGEDNCPLNANFSQADTDGDGFGNACDTCPSDPVKGSPGQCGCGFPDTDTDGDTSADCVDQCDNDPLKSRPGICGCGVSDRDSDGDTTADCLDGCPADPFKVAPGACGCGLSDADVNGDTVPDCGDSCPGDPNKTEPGQCGCGVPDTDTDGDTTADCNDGCVNDPMKVAPGACGCGVPDMDADGDTVADCVDNCRLASNASQADSDGDLVGDPCDNCPSQVNGGQANADGDARGDACDCAPADPMDLVPGRVTNVRVGTTGHITWTTLAGTLFSDVVGGVIAEMRNDGDIARASCVANALAVADYTDARPMPPRIDGYGAYYYLVRAGNACGRSDLGTDSFGTPHPFIPCP